MELLRSSSRQELDALANLVVDIVVGVFYFSGAAAIGLEAGLVDAAIAGHVVQTVILAILLSAALFGAIRLFTEEEPKDERDHKIQAQANSTGYYALTAGTVGVIGHVVLSSVSGAEPALLSARLLMHMLFSVLILASVARSLVQLFHYRRGI